MEGGKIPNTTKYGLALDLVSLRVFVAVVESGSFVAAGKKLGMTRSAAGKALSRLENYLETRLLHRTTRKVTLTTEGQEFYQRCSQILNDLIEAEQCVRTEPGKLKGVLKITVSEGYGKNVLIPFIQEFQQANPAVTFDVSFTDRIIDLVEEGIDLAIRVGDLHTSTEFITRVIDRSKIGLLASPEYLKRNKKPLSISELDQHQLLIFNTNPGLKKWHLKNDSEEYVTITPKKYIKFDSGDAIRVACCCGMGISFLPDFLVKKELSEGILVPVKLGFIEDEIKIHAIYPNRIFLPNRVRIFLDTLIAYLEKEK